MSARCVCCCAAETDYTNSGGEPICISCLVEIRDATAPEANEQIEADLTEARQQASEREVQS